MPRKFSNVLKKEVCDLYLDHRDLTYKEIAKMTGVSEGSVGTILTLAKTPRRKPKHASIVFGFPQRTKNPNDKNSWGKGFAHMNLKFKKQ